MMNEHSNTDAINKIALPLEAEAIFLANRYDLPIEGGVLRLNRTNEQLQEIFSLKQRYESALRQRKKNQATTAQSDAWQRHKVFLYNISSRQGSIQVSVIDCSLVPESKRIDMHELQTYFKNQAVAEQLSFSANQVERWILQEASEYCNLQLSSFVLQAATGVARFINEVTVNDSSPVEVEQVVKLLHQAYSLRDTQLFTADEIRELGLTPEQGEKLGIMIAQKQAGLQGVKNTVSGGEQTA